MLSPTEAKASDGSEHRFAGPTYSGMPLKYNPEVAAIAGPTYMELSALGGINADPDHPAGAVVTFIASARDSGHDATPVVTCTQASGTTLGIGRRP